CRCAQPGPDECPCCSPQLQFAVIADLETLTGVEVRRARVDKGYKRRADGMLKHPCRHRFRLWISGQAPIASVPPGSCEFFSRFEPPHGRRGVVATLL